MECFFLLYIKNELKEHDSISGQNLRNLGTTGNILKYLFFCIMNYTTYTLEIV